MRDENHHDTRSPRLSPPHHKEEIPSLMTPHEMASDTGGFEAGIRLAVQRILVSPDFLFRIEVDPCKRSVRLRLSHQRRGARVTSIVFPLEQQSR